VSAFTSKRSLVRRTRKGARHGLVLAIVALAGPTTSIAQQPLFDSDSILALRLEAPVGRILGEREATTHEGHLTLAGVSSPIPTGVRARGKSRLRSGICSFPGLMLQFEPGAVAGTVFAGQSSLPVTTHCRDRSDYEQYVVLEYLAYRAYELVNEASLHARLAQIEYYDTERGRVVTTRYAFFVEHWDDLGERQGWTMVQAPAVPPWEYPAGDRNRFEVFQYMIGNTDWSYASAEPDETFCCHNAVPIGHPAGPVFPVPFDFDQAGIVNAAYARPSSRLPIRSVRQRLYRGMCLERQVLDATLARFRDIRPALRALFENEAALTDRSRADALRYLDGFYETLDDPGAVDRAFVSTCRNVGP